MEDKLLYKAYWNKQALLLDDDYQYLFRQTWSTYPDAGVTELDVTLSVQSMRIVHAMGGGSAVGSFVILLSGIYILLYKYGKLDIVEVNTPLFDFDGNPGNVDGREVPLVLTLNDEMTVRELVHYVQETVTDSYNFQDTDLYETLAKFRTNVFVYAPEIHRTHAHKGNGIQLELILENELKIRLSGSAGFSRKFLSILGTALDQILSGFENPNARLADVGYVEAYPHDGVEALQTTDIQGQTLHRLFELQATATPANTAIQTNNRQLSYFELNKESDKAAWYLKERCNIKKGDVVGVMIDRSEWMIIAMLGIMKAGAVYLPLNPENPWERTRFMLKDANVKVLLIKMELFSTIGHLDMLQLIPFNSVLQSTAVEKYEPVSCDVVGNDAAYIIYTSGSTGSPKGVVVEHQALAYSMTAHIDVFGITENERIPLFFPGAFDASLKQVFLCLFTGSTLLISDKDVLEDPGQFLLFLNKWQATVANISPAYLRVLDKEKLTSIVRKVITGGEAPDVKDALFIASRIDYYNSYGPTEAAVCCVNYKVDPSCSYGKTIPIGVPVTGTEILILDKYHRPLPIGIAGEIAISGRGLARGYLNNPTLTLEKFASHPYRFNERVYLSGDMGIRLPDGNLEYLGRRDNQVKIRGYRIEPDEITQNLLSHPLIIQAIVIKRFDVTEEDCLVAYIVTAGSINTEQVLTYLKKQLPAFMLPYFILQLPALPLTNNGKIDEKALPHPQQITGDAAMAIAPRNELDAEIAAIWTTVLGKSGFSINDNFFDLGGTSLQVIKIFEKLNARFPDCVKISEIFDNPTIAAQSELIAGRTGEKIDQEQQYNITSFG